MLLLSVQRVISANRNYQYECESEIGRLSFTLWKSEAPNYIEPGVEDGDSTFDGIRRDRMAKVIALSSEHDLVVRKSKLLAFLHILVQDNLESAMDSVWDNEVGDDGEVIDDSVPAEMT